MKPHCLAHCILAYLSAHHELVEPLLDLFMWPSGMWKGSCWHLVVFALLAVKMLGDSLSVTVYWLVMSSIVVGVLSIPYICIMRYGRSWLCMQILCAFRSGVHLCIII